MTADDTDHIRGRLLAPSLALVLGVSITGCLELDTEHCLAQGGDLGCNGLRCYIPTAMTVDPISDEHGCELTDIAPTLDQKEHHLHVKYGLPASAENPGDPRDDDSVSGILRLSAEARNLSSCSIDIGSETIFEIYDDGIGAIRERLEERGRTRRIQTRVSEADVKLIKSFRSAINDWLEGCQEQPAGESET